jgi:hypothetical protein
MIPIQFNNIEKEKIHKAQKKSPTSKLVKNEILEITNFRVAKYYKPISRLL